MGDLRVVPAVYLAGGMKGDWQDKVKRRVKGVIFIDPRDHGLVNKMDYTAWDLKGVAMSDIVFGYLEKDNPSGAGLAVEFGYAKALGKTLIYVEEIGFTNARYFGMVQALADKRTYALDKGIEMLISAVRAHL